MADKAQLTKEELSLLELALEAQIRSLKLSAAKQVRPQFREVISSEVRVFEALKAKIGGLNG